MQALALFDLDDTLIDRRAAFHTWAEEFTAAHRLEGNALTFLVMADAHHSGPMDSFFTLIRAEYDLAEAPEELWSQYRRRMPELVSCRAGDLDALRRLRRAGWRTGIVTNGTADNQTAKIRNTGLADEVDGWAISGEIGIRKPDPEVFRIAAARCGMSLDQGGWMVGDNLELDITGGHGAGLRTVWVQPRPGPGLFTGPAPDITVSSVAEAVDQVLDQGP